MFESFHTDLRGSGRKGQDLIPSMDFFANLASNGDCHADKLRVFT